MPDLITFGEALIDLPSLQSGVGLADASGFAKVPAGAPANVAVAAVKLGLSAAFVSKVGADPFGDAIIKTFGGYGVDTSQIIQDTAARTGLAFVSIRDDGEREFLFYFDPARDLAIGSDEIDLDFYAETRAFHYGSISLIAPPTRGMTIALANYVQQVGGLISYDPNLRPRLWTDDETMRVQARAGLTAAHVVKVSAEEIRFLFPAAKSEGEAIQALFLGYERPLLIAVTDGGKGSTGYLRTGERAHAPGISVNVLDATGAGDAFMAGLIASLLRLTPDHEGILSALPFALPDALRYANACGALATTQRGATLHFLTPEALQALRP